MGIDQQVLQDVPQTLRPLLEENLARIEPALAELPVSYTHLTLPTKRIV